MSKILILLAHPDVRRSRVNRRMVEEACALDNVTVVDLYALYPRFKIDPVVEQQRLIDHDIIVLQFPFYWYSTPSLLKEWLDLVLSHGFAYGQEGNQLKDKPLLIATTAGGSAKSYSRRGSNQFPIRTLLSPLEQTACLCKMMFLPPLVLFDSITAAQDQRMEEHIRQYCRLLDALVGDRLDLDVVNERELMSDFALPLVPVT